MTLPLLDDLPGRDEARELARHELERRAYDEARPPLATRVIQWVLDKVQELLGTAAASVPGGGVGVLLIVLLAGGLAALVVIRLRPTIRGASTTPLFGPGQELSADAHRGLAEQAAARGAYADAVRERLRAVVRQLEERGILDPRPGRTAIEVSVEAGRQVPALAVPLRRAATTFEQIWYGGQPADASSYTVVVEVDRVVGEARVGAR